MNWRETRLKYLSAAPMINGLGEAGTNDDPTWPRYVRTTDIAGPTALRKDVFASLPPSIASKAMLQQGDILMTAAGATIGKSVTFNEDYPACYAGFLVRFRPGLAVDGRFVAYWMQSAPYWHQIQAGAVRSTIENFSGSKYQGMSLLLPPLATQRRIADFLDNQVAVLDRTIDLRQRQVGLMVQRAVAEVEDVLRPEGQGWIEVPARRLVRDIGVGIVIHPAALYTDADDGVPAVRGTDIRPGEISTEGLIRLTPAGHMANPRSRLRQGDVLVVRTGRAGAAARVPEGLVGANCIDVVIVRPGRNISAGYLEHSINSHRAQEVIFEHSTGAIQRHFGVDAMKALPVVSRPLGQQARIVRRLDEDRERHERVTVALHRSLDLLRERKFALITAAVTGAFDVTTARSAA